MSFAAIVVLAIGVALDAAAVAAAKGLATPVVLPRHVLLVAVLFGGFQALMPLIGWGLGSRLGPFIEAWDHWVAFALLAGIGGTRIWEARGGARAVRQDAVDPFALRGMVLLAIATSIDALAVGVSLPMLNAPLVASVATIGITTAALSVLGLFAGRKCGALLGKRLDVAGGVVLIGIGAKILMDHLRAG